MLTVWLPAGRSGSSSNADLSVRSIDRWKRSSGSRAALQFLLLAAVPKRCASRKACQVAPGAGSSASEPRVAFPRTSPTGARPVGNPPARLGKGWLPRSGRTARVVSIADSPNWPLTSRRRPCNRSQTPEAQHQWEQTRLRRAGTWRSDRSRSPGCLRFPRSGEP